MPFFNKWRNTDEFRPEALKFLEHGYYIEYPEGTYEYDEYWDRQERIIKEGMTNSVGQRISGIHYFYLNFVVIYNKARRQMTFPDFWDTDAWIFSEVEEAKIQGKHLCLLKCRQRGGSLKFASIPLASFYLNRYSINYIGAYIEDKANRAWEMIEHMSDHLDRNTDWKKNKMPYTKSFWKAQFKETIGDREVLSGYKSELHKVSFRVNPAAGVGGAVDNFLYDEAGLSPSVLDSVLYIDPACSDGSIRTGTILVVGSVGELDDSAGLNTLFYEPDSYGFMSYENTWDEELEGTSCGLFIPEYYSLKGFIDEWGNSKIDEAKEYCLKVREKKKKSDPEKYRLYISQHPFTPKEAFDHRKESIFPVRLIDEQILHIQQNSLHGRTVRLDYDVSGKVRYKDINNPPVRDFPVKADTAKDGVVVLWEEPIQDASWGTYYAGVDPVRNIKTTTSKSLSCIYIYKRQLQSGTAYIGDEIVACYTGRFDDYDKTNEEIEKLIELYNAQALVENDVTSFIEHMIKKKKQRYLMRKNDLPLIQEYNLNPSSHAVYGITATPSTKKKLFEMVLLYLKEEFDRIYDDKGELVKTVRGINKIKDIMLLTEMRMWHDGLNVDRIVAFGYSLMAARSQSQHTTMKIENQEDYIQQNKQIIQGLVKSPFRNIGSDRNELSRIRRNPFKNIKL
jgi:hypothetical protein